MQLRKMLVVGLVAAAVVVIPNRVEPATLPPNPYSVKLGMAMGANRLAFTSTSMAGVKDLGASWVRLDFSWKDIEEVRGQFTWADTDREVANARAQGLKVLGVIAYTPEYAHHPECSGHPCAPRLSMYDDFARFAARVATRYQGKVNVWEIWNEPNEANFWRPRPQPAGYALLLRQAYASIKQAVPAARVLLGGLSTHPTDTDGWLTWRTFMDRFYQAGGAPFDAFAIHPHYASGRPSHNVPENPFINLPKTMMYLAAHGDGDKRIWITEFGYKTGALTPRQQGERLKEALGYVVRWTFVERMFVFAWRDFRNSNGFVLTWGLNDVDGRAKESRWLLRSYVRSRGG